MTAPARDPWPEKQAGGYTRLDGSVEFYGRVQALLPAEGVVLDFGAGRGKWLEDPCAYRRDLNDLRGPGRLVIGADPDPAIAANSGLDAAVLSAPDLRLPLREASVDLIVADWVLEHLDRPEAFVTEMERVLRPGGWLCARTPNRWGYVGIGARLVPNRMHTRLLARLQPARAEKDVFATAYRMNTAGSLAALFRSEAWTDASYPFNPDPDYAGRSRTVTQLISIWQTVAPAALATDIFLFLQRR